MTNAEILMIVLTAVIAVTGIIGSFIFNNQLSVMQGQLDSMRQDQRPWVSVTMDPNGSLEHDAGAWTYTFNYKLANVGRTPAKDVDFLATVIPWGPPKALNDGSPSMFPDQSNVIADLTEQICNEMTGPNALRSGQVMFPGQEKNLTFRAQPLTGVAHSGYVRDFIVIGCATYRIQGESGPRRTIVVQDVAKAAHGQLINLGGEAIEPRALLVVPHPGANSAS